MSQEPLSLDALTLEDGHLFHDRKGRPKPLPRAWAPLADTHGHLTCLRRHDPSVALCRAALAGVRLLVVPVDPVDELPRTGDPPQALLDWVDRQVDQAAQRIDECADHGLVPPVPEGWEGGLPSLVDNVYLLAGAHPYGAPQLDADALARMEALLASPRCVGVGEIGLDFGPYSEVPAEVQERAFRRQLRMAHELGLPVELHIRDAQDDPEASAHRLAARILGEEGVPERGCDLHCFTQGPEVMAPFVELGCHVAFGGAATFRRSDDIRAAAVACPAGRILSETDCPYMAPVPLRGEECEFAMVAWSAACLADARDEAGVAPGGETYRVLWDNACAFLTPGLL